MPGTWKATRLCTWQVSHAGKGTLAMPVKWQCRLCLWLWCALVVAGGGVWHELKLLLLGVFVGWGRGAVRWWRCG